jgi:hypothetical protein
MAKRKGPSQDDLLKIGNVRVPTDWQPFGGFDDYVSSSEEDVEEHQAYRRHFHADIVKFQSPDETSATLLNRVPRGCEIYLMQASLNVIGNVPEGTRVVLSCKTDGHSLVLCHFRVGFVETCVLGQLEFQEGIEYELSFKVQKPAFSAARNLEVHVSGYKSFGVLGRQGDSSDEEMVDSVIARMKADPMDDEEEQTSESEEEDSEMDSELEDEVRHSSP